MLTSQVRHPNRALGCSNRRSRNRSSSASPKDLYNQARAQMKAERKAERKAKIEEFKANIKSKFDKLKA